jgi:hypothetical protein
MLWGWLLLAAIAMVVFLLPALILPVWGASFIERMVTSYLHTPVTVQGVTGSWWGGISVHQLRIAEDFTPQAPTLLRVETISVPMPLPSLWLSTQPIGVRLDGVHFDLRRRQDGQCNLTSVVKRAESEPSTGIPRHGAIARLNRQLNLTLTHGTLRLGETIEFADLNIGLRLAAGRLSVTQALAKVAGGALMLHGEMSLQEPTADTGLRWQATGLHLDQLLGPAFQSVTLATATGRIATEGGGLSLKTAATLPTFALSPGTLGHRQPRLTDVALTCTVHLLPPFTRLVTEVCRLQATEAQLSLRHTAMHFDAEPQLALQVNGSLTGPLVAALVPEVPGQFPDPVHVQGELSIPFRESLWHTMGWRLSVSSGRFLFDDMLTEVHTIVVKSGDHLEITDLRARRGSGSIHGAGAWRMAEPVAGGLQVEADHLPLRQAVGQNSSGGPHVLEGVLSGTVAWGTHAQGEELTLDARVHAVSFSRSATKIVQLPEGRVRGRVAHEGGDRWRGGTLVFLSDGLTAELREVSVRRSPTDYHLSGVLDLQVATDDMLRDVGGDLLPSGLRIAAPIALAATPR